MLNNLLKFKTLSYFFLFLLLEFLFILPKAYSFPTQPTSSKWFTDESVYTSLIAPDGKVYLGGDFTHLIHPTEAKAAIANANTGEISSTIALSPGGVIHTVVPDNQGGWYVGGSFTTIQGENIPNLAHLNADGSVDKQWPSSHPNGLVKVIKISQDKMFIGGDFSLMGTTPMFNIAALDLMKGDLIPDWNANISSSLPNSVIHGVNAIEISNNVLFIGGTFFGFPDANNQAYVAALDIKTGSRLKTFNPQKLNGPVATLQINNNVLYIGGEFTKFTFPSGGTLDIQHLAALTLTGDPIQSWKPQPNKAVYSLKVNNNILYIGGHFTQLSNVYSNFFASIDISDLTKLQINSNSPPMSGDVYSLTLSEDAKSLYLGGEFTSVSGQSRPHFAILDLSNNAALKETPIGGYCIDNTSPCSTSASALQGQKIFLAGDFTFIGQIADRHYLAALDSNGNLILSWKVDADKYVTALALSGNTLYVGGGFTQIGKDASGKPLSHERLAAVDTTQGNVIDSWKVDANKPVYTLALSGHTLYVGGEFTQIGKDGSGNPLSHRHLAAVDTTQGNVIDNWKVDADDDVKALALSSNTLYVGGLFTQIGKDESGALLSHERLAAVDTTQGNVIDSWKVDANSYVYALALSGHTLYVGGHFTQIGKDGSGTRLNHNSLAAVDTTQGNVIDSWKVDANSYVDALALSGHTLYAGGGFTKIGNDASGNPLNHTYLAAVDTTQGNVIDSWKVDADSYVYALALSGNTLYVGGSFNFINDQFAPNLAQFQSSNSVQFTQTTLQAVESAGTINIELSTAQPADTQDVTVTYEITGGNAQKGIDSKLENGMAIIPAGQSKVTIPLALIDNQKPEGNRTLEITLTHSTNASLGANHQLLFTIIDDETSSSQGAKNGGGCSLSTQDSSAVNFGWIGLLFIAGLLLRRAKMRKDQSHY